MTREARSERRYLHGFKDGGRKKAASQGMGVASKSWEKQEFLERNANDPFILLVH